MFCATALHASLKWAKKPSLHSLQCCSPDHHAHHIYDKDFLHVFSPPLCTFCGITSRLNFVPHVAVFITCYSWAVVIQFCIVNNTAALISEAAHPCHFELNNLVTTVFYCTYTLHIVVTFYVFGPSLHCYILYCHTVDYIACSSFCVSISPEGLHIRGFPVLKHFMPWVLGCSLNFSFLQKKSCSSIYHTLSTFDAV